MWLRRALCACIALALVACDGGGETPVVRVRPPAASPTTPAGPVIGLVGTMSGPGAWRGEDAFEGADLGVNLLNQRRRDGALPFQLVTVDDRGEPDRATRLVEQLASDRRTVGIVYAGPPSGIAGAADALEAAGIPAVICHGDLYSAGNLRSHLFQVAPPLLWQARRHANYIARDRRYRRVGLLAGSGMDGDTATRVTRAALRQQGVSLARVHRFDASEDFDPLLDDLERRRVEALLVKGPPDSLPRVVAALQARGALYRSTAAARTVTAPARVRRRERNPNRRRPWRPHLMGFDLAISPANSGSLPAGTTASDSYARGVYLLPIPNFRDYREAFSNWWGSEPTGWERRAFDAASMIGWAARRAEPGDDVAAVLEGLRGVRFGGLDIAFGPDDHTAMEERTVGLWVIPRAGLALRERDRLPKGMPWVMLGRGFSTNGRHSAVPPDDWEYLFRNPPRRSGPGPRIRAGRFGVTTARRDPVH